MLSQITLVYNLRSQYIFNDLPRKRQSEFMKKIYGFNRWPSKNDLSRTIHLEIRQLVKLQPSLYSHSLEWLNN